MMFVNPDNTGADNFECRLSDRTPSSLKHAEVRGEVAKQYPMNCENYQAAFQGHGRLWRDRGVLLRRPIASIVWLLLVVSTALGQQKANEYQVKAAYLYNFGRFVE